MRDLICVVSGGQGDYAGKMLEGVKVRVTGITKDRKSYCEVLDNAGKESVEVGAVIGFFPEALVPEDLSVVPEANRVDQVVINAWVFSEARNDAWKKDQGQPNDLVKYRELNGKDWKEERTYNVKKVSY